MQNQQTFFNFPQAMLDLFEKQWTVAANSTAKEDVFSEVMQSYLQTAAYWQDVVTKTNTAWLNSMNLPTREDVALTNEQIVYLEERLEQVEEKFAQAESQNARIVYLEHELSTLRTEYSSLLTQIQGLSDKLSTLVEGNGVGASVVTKQATPAASKTRKSSRSKMNSEATDSSN